jgi:RHS repeat-associated protein
MRKGGTLYWLLTDHLGSTALTATSSGGKSAELRYKAWGETRYTYGTTPTTYRFTGQREDATIGLYFYNARFYDPYLNRWIQPDIIVPDCQNPQSLNRYSYVYNNPLRFRDPTGNWPEWLDRLRGATMQFVNDMTFGAPTAIFGDAWQYEQNEAFQEGREIGRDASVATSIVLTVDGGKNAAAGLSALGPTAATTAACTAGTGGACALPGGVALVGEAGMVLLGSGEAIYGGAVIHYASKNPLTGRGSQTIQTAKGPLTSSQNPGDTKLFVQKHWNKGTFNSALDSAAYHLGEHGKGMTIQEYTEMAQGFFRRNWRSGEIVRSYDDTMDLLRINIDDGFGIFTQEGQVVTFEPKW